METFAADLRYAVRTMRRNLGVTAIALAAIAIGIGANTAIFTVVDAVLLQPLPYAQPDRLMKLGRKYPQGVGYSNSIPKYTMWRDNDVFAVMTVYDFGALAMNLGAGNPPEPVQAVHVSADYFAVFGVAPILGRSFSPTEDLPQGPPVAVISARLWQSRFGGAQDIVGRSILLNGVSYNVVGVVPTGFHSDPDADLWIPMQADPNSVNQGHYLSVAGRLKPGVTVAQARAQMAIIGERFRKANPKWMDQEEGVGVVPMREAMTGDVRTALWVLFGAVALVLLIACVNVANLLLARAAGRQRELAVRAAMGASRARVVRQLLTESVLLAGCGGLLGLALGAWGVRGLLLLVPGDLPRVTDPATGGVMIPALDWRVVAFTLALAVVTGIVFGLFPALQTSKPNLVSTLKDASGRSGTAVRHKRVRSALVVIETALALVLLVGAALLIRSFLGLRSVDAGLDAHNVFTFQTSLAGTSYSTTANVSNFSTQVVRRLETVPGLTAAASMIALPVEAGIDLPFTIVGRAPTRGEYSGEEQWRSISPHYFSAFKIPLVRGREFGDGDAGAATRVVIVNDAMAKKYWPNADPIGQQIVIGKGLGPQFDEPAREVVGIVGNVRENGLGNAGIGVMYIPQAQMTEGLTTLANSVLPLSWAVRTATAPSSLRIAIDRELHAVDGQITVAKPRTMEQVLSGAVARQNFNMVLLSIFAGAALVLAAIGLYGLMSYSVDQRTREIGIRMALGANRATMLRAVLREAMTLAGIGVVLGLGLAYGLTRVLASLLFGVKASDPYAFAIVAGVLTLVAAAAALIPARRATTIDPAIALRYE
ncbi:MAG TPA: ABC transporter permease [Vicinamibacterales bacterium]|nr:ABC transporter permease [Vicinamibacterales bacterium]